MACRFKSCRPHQKDIDSYQGKYVFLCYKRGASNKITNNIKLIAEEFVDEIYIAIIYEYKVEIYDIGGG